jgi:hypothetical protein
MGAIQADRHALLNSDLIRSLLFILLTAGLLWAFVAGKLSKKYVFVILPVLILADMWPVNKRYLNNDDFDRKNTVEKPYKATVADQAILKDKTTYYRVFNLTEDLDKSARTSYFHKNLGGYHGAKLRRYQEMIDLPLSAERGKLVDALVKEEATPESIFAVMRNMPAINMLNTRYVIFNNDAEPIMNPYALGNAWFVKGVKVVQNADEEIAALDGLAPDSIALVDKRFQDYLDSHAIQPGPKGKIELTKYHPNQLNYNYEASSDQLAVFSEIFYEKGWNAYLDGRKVPHIRVNYVLRGMVLPAGKHELEYRFEPKSYYTGQNISLVSSLFILLLAVAYLLKQYRRKGQAG